MKGGPRMDEKKIIRFDTITPQPIMFSDLVAADSEYLYEMIRDAADGHRLYPWDLFLLSMMIPSTIPNGIIANCRIINCLSDDIPFDFDIRFQFDRFLYNGWLYYPKDDTLNPGIEGFLQVKFDVDYDTYLTPYELILKARKEKSAYQILSLNTKPWIEEIYDQTIWSNWNDNWDIIQYFMTHRVPKVFNLLVTKLKDGDNTKHYYHQLDGTFRRDQESYYEMIEASDKQRFMDEFHQGLLYEKQCAIDPDEIKYQVRGWQLISITTEDMNEIIQHILNGDIEGSGKDEV